MTVPELSLACGRVTLARESCNTATPVESTDLTVRASLAVQ